ncbi:hypothetical protein HY745_00940 [Candidatus Desantisbacteria bacterium]|nr:hypothetical protein [Candidatus Desantisbacteria bacterium]
MKKFSFVIIFVFLIFFSVSVVYSDDMVLVTGRMLSSAPVRLNDQSTEEYPSVLGRIKLKVSKSSLHFLSLMEGGVDGTIRSPRRDHYLFKNYHDVYQDNTPYLEFKELYLTKSYKSFDLKVGIQRFSWGRLDDYPVNDLLNPWDYTRFILKSLEDRKIGVPSISANVSKEDWAYQAVWVPIFVPYRLAKPNERWSGIPVGTVFSKINDAEVLSGEPDLASNKLENSSFGFRMQRMGEIEWAINLFYGFDPRPVFKTTELSISEFQGKLLIDPGIVPSFHKIASVGTDAAMVKGDWSLRAESAYTFNRFFNIRSDLWGYPQSLIAGVTPLNPIEIKRDTLDYGIAADYNLFEDGLLTMQLQQTLIFKKPDTLYNKTIETILWANLKVGWMNQKLETNFNLASNPEHGANMVKANAYYVFDDSWKTGITAILLDGPPQSLWGMYSKNDQIGMEVVYSW